MRTCNAAALPRPAPELARFANETGLVPNNILVQLSLTGADLGIRARVIGGQSSGMGTVIAATSPFAQRGSGPEGRSVAPSAVDGVDRIVALRRVADDPL